MSEKRSGPPASCDLPLPDEAIELARRDPVVRMLLAPGNTRVRVEHLAELAKWLPESAVSTAPMEDGPPTVNDRMWLELSRVPESTNWTQEQWAARLGCSRGMIAKCKTWGYIMAMRDRNIADRVSAEGD